MNQSYNSLTVAVTGANSNVGRMLLPRLVEINAFAIALVRSPTELPAKHVICDWVSSPVAMQAMQNADAIVHLSGELFTKNAKDYQIANVETTAVVAKALKNGRAKRVIFISYVGANTNSSNLYLQTKGEAEELLLASTKEAVIFRCPAIINTPNEPGPLEENLKVVKNGKARILGHGKQRQQPVYRGDVVAAIVAAIKHGTPGIYELTGPEEMTADELVGLVNRNPEVGISHTPGWLARLASSFIPDLSPTVVDVMLRDSTGNPDRAIAEFGLELTSLRSLWK